MNILAEARRYAAYRRTVRELKSLDAATKADLDIAPYEITAIARRSVWG